MAHDGNAPGSTPSPAAPGWRAIEDAFQRVYSGQKARHWAPRGVRRMHDLKKPPANPLDGVSVYDAGTFWHYVSFGLTELYGKESQNAWSGFGFELTFRVAKRESEKQPPLWPIDVMVSVARAQFGGAGLGPKHTIKTGPLDGRPETKLTALLLTEDPAFETVQTPHGYLVFLLLVGIESADRERALASGHQVVLEELLARDENLVTRV